MSASPIGPADDHDDNQALRARLTAAGFDLDQLARSLAPASTEMLLEAAVAAGLPRLAQEHAGSYKTWGPYLTILATGLPDLCPCPCIACSTGPCVCTAGTGGHSTLCIPPRNEPGLDCARRYTGVGKRPISEVRPDDITDGGWWAQRRGLKRTVARNVKRSAAHRVLLPHDGRGARESFIQGARWLFTWLLDNDHVTKNPASKVKLPARAEAGARSLDADEFVKVYQIAVTTGRDPELDGLMLRHLLIQGLRRGGLLATSAGGLDVAGVAIRYWDEKRKQWRSRPTTTSHMKDLLTHTLERGPRVAAPVDASEEERRGGLAALTDTDAVFYLRPMDLFDHDGYFVSRKVRPASRKRVEAVFSRVRKELEWADRRGLRCHDIRHTSARMVYKAADQQMVRLHLAHDAGSTTDHYLTEQIDQLRRLKEEIFDAPQEKVSDDDEDDGEE